MLAHVKAYASVIASKVTSYWLGVVALIAVTPEVLPQWWAQIQSVIPAKWRPWIIGGMAVVGIFTAARREAAARVAAARAAAIANVPPGK